MAKFNVEVNFDQVASEIVMVKGEKGDTGNTGATGPSNTLAIGTVAKGDNAEATITGTSPNQTLNLVLPKGDKGDTGATGTGIPSGGTTGQVVAKTADGTEWIDVYTKTETDSAIADKALKLQNITIPHASVVANTDSLSATFPYCYDYADSTITADTVIQDIVAQDSSNQTAYDGYCFGANITGAGTVRIYFIAQPSSDMAVTLMRQKGVRE